MPSPDPIDALLDVADAYDDDGMPRTARATRDLAAHLVGRRRVLGFRVPFLWGVGALVFAAVVVWWGVLGSDK